MSSGTDLILDHDFEELVRHALAGVSQREQVIIRSDAPDDARYMVPFDNWTVAVPMQFYLEGETFDPSGGLQFSRANGNGLLDVRLGHGGDPSQFVSEFVSSFFGELHRILCKKNAMTKASGYTAKGAATALATWIAQKARVTEPFAIATAVVIIMILAEATKGAFCSKTEAQLKKALDRRRS